MSARMPWFRPQGPFAGVQLSMAGTYINFFDPRTGDVWNYNGEGKIYDHFKLVKLGAPLVEVK